MPLALSRLCEYLGAAVETEVLFDPVAKRTVLRVDIPLDDLEEQGIALLEQAQSLRLEVLDADQGLLHRADGQVIGPRGAVAVAAPAVAAVAEPPLNAKNQCSRIQQALAPLLLPRGWELGTYPVWFRRKVPAGTWQIGGEIKSRVHFYLCLRTLHSRALETLRKTEGFTFDFFVDHRWCDREFGGPFSKSKIQGDFTSFVEIRTETWADVERFTTELARRLEAGLLALLHAAETPEQVLALAIGPNAYDGPFTNMNGPDPANSPKLRGSHADLAMASRVEGAPLATLFQTRREAFLQRAPASVPDLDLLAQALKLTAGTAP